MHFGAIKVDSGENVHILGGDCIGHREKKKSSYEHVSNSERLLGERRLNLQIPYILESNPHPFYGFRGLKNQMRIRIACGLDSRSRAGFWKNDTAAVSAVRTIR